MATFRVFISSSFLDFQNERNALHETVFPKLEELCETHGAYFQAVDLRWGISEDEGKAYNTLDICLNEVRRAARITPKPNFLILAGDRYGWRPLPPQINAKLFQKLIKASSDNDKGIIESTWVKDLNSVDPIYVLRDRADASLNEAIIRAALDRAIENANLSEEEIIETSASATHREILARKELPEYISGNVHCIIRDLNHVPQSLRHEFYDGENDPHAKTMCSNLKDTLKRAFPDAYTYTADISETGEFEDDELLKSFCDEVYNRLERNILDELEKIKEDYMGDEVLYHKLYALNCHQNFCLGSRSKMKLPEMSRFHRLWKEDVVLVGEPGSGMSMMMGELAYRVQHRSKKSKVIIRFIGESGNSADINNLLKGILAEIGVENAESISDPQLYIQNHPFKSPVVLLLDGVEKSKNPKWLIRYLMDNEDGNLRLYLSMNKELYSSFPEKVKRKHRMVELPPLETSDAKEILKERLLLEGRKLTANQSESIINAFEKKKDLKFLNDLIHDAIAWRSDEAPHISMYSHDDILRNYFSDLKDENRTNRMLCLYTVRFLLTSREGLSDDELLDLLGRQEQVVDELKRYSFHEFSEGKIPFMYLSRFLETLRPFLKENLSEGKVVLRFSDPVAIERASEYAWNDEEKEKRETRLAIASYFETKVDTIFTSMLKALVYSLDGTIADYRTRLNSRIALEYPWQLLEAGEYERLYRFISDRRFFTFLCDRNLGEILTYWTAVERETSHSIKESFEDVYTNPEDERNETIIRPLLDLMSSHGGLSEEIAMLSKAGGVEASAENSEYIQGQSLIDTGRYDEAIEASENMISHSDEGSIHHYDALYIKAQALYRQEKYQDALDIFIELEALGRNLEERSRIFNALKWQASCYKAMAMKEEAMDIYMVLEDYVDEDSDVGDAIVTLFEASTGIAMFKNMYEGEKKLLVAMNMAEKLGNRTWLETIYQNAIMLFSLTGDQPEKAEEVFEKWVAIKLEDDPNFDIPNDVLSNYFYAVYPFLTEETGYSIEMYNVMKKTRGIREELNQDRTPQGRIIAKAYEYIMDNVLPGLKYYMEARQGNAEYFRNEINEVIEDRFEGYAEGTNEGYQKMVDAIEAQDSGKELPEEDLRGLKFYLMGMTITMGLKDCLIDSLIDESKDSAKMVMASYNNVYVRQNDWWRSNIPYGAYRLRMNYNVKVKNQYDAVNAEVQKMLEDESPMFKSIMDSLMQQKKDHENEK